MSTTTVQEIQAAADALVAAFAEGRLDDYFGAFASEATFVFHTTPQRLGSTAEYRALWQQWVEQDGFRILGCTSSAQLIQPFGDTAVFSHDVETQVATDTAEETLHERETIVFARTGVGRWTAVHEHLSARTAA
ncbi:nuclear transport factor 2 family protein [Streptomyces sp. NPDC054962]